MIDLLALRDFECLIEKGGKLIIAYPHLIATTVFYQPFTHFTKQE